MKQLLNLINTNLKSSSDISEMLNSQLSVQFSGDNLTISWLLKQTIYTDKVMEH